MINSTDGLFLAGTLASLCALYFLIKIIRRDHPYHVHTLWYVFSLTLCIVFPYFIYYYASGEMVHDLLSPHGPRTGYQQVRDFIFRSLTDPVGDIYFALGVLYIAIMPQIFSFFVSGLFGCGSRPILALEITKFAILGLIKSFCCLSAILVARMLLQLSVSTDFFGDNNFYGRSQGPTLFQAAIYMCLAFSMSYVYLELDKIRDYIPGFSRFILPLTKFLTRYSQRVKVAPSPQDVELLLRPAISHILGDIEISEVATFILRRRLSGRKEAQTDST